MNRLRLPALACAGLLVLTTGACRRQPQPPAATTTTAAPTTTTAPPGGPDWGGIEPAGTIPQPSPPAPAGCVTDVGPGENLKVTGCGAGITYSVTVPPECLRFKCGLVFDIHGMTMSAASQNGGTDMRAIGQREKYIVVQPTASGGAPDDAGVLQTRWDFGTGDASPAVADFVRTAIAVWKPDTRRVHVMGFSMGGSMTWWLRCRLPEELASVAPMSFSNANGGRCPEVMTPVLYQMGGATDALSGDATMTNGLGDGTDAAHSYSATMLDVVRAYGLGAPEEVASGEGYTWHRFAKGRFVFETLVHSWSTPVINGHCMFGAPDQSLLCSCKGTQPIKEGENAIAFFKKHPKGV